MAMTAASPAVRCHTPTSIYDGVQEPLAFGGGKEAEDGASRAPTARCSGQMGDAESGTSCSTGPCTAVKFRVAPASAAPTGRSNAQADPPSGGLDRRGGAESGTSCSTGPVPQ
jgi:hypothetical protein